MKNLRPFQIGLLGMFVLIAFGSIIAIARYSGGGGGAANPYGNSVVIWGIFDEEILRPTLQEIVKADKAFNVVDYIEKDPRTFEEELINAIAEGRSPDVIILQHEDLVTYRPKLLPISYDTITRRDYNDMFIDGTRIFAREDGIYSIPIAVDPLVMYWNRDIFATGGLASPPSTWENLINTVAPTLTLRDTTRNILQGTVAFGEYRNVVNAKEVLSMLIIQSGSRLVEEDGDKYIVALNEPFDRDTLKPVTTALDFYTTFSNANEVLYSWNRAQQDDRVAFLAEDLALYFGMGSEAPKLRELNPNFNFDVAPVPQGSGVTIKRTYGTFYGFSILNASQNQTGAYNAIQKLTAAETAGVIAEGLNLSPVSPVIIDRGAENPYRQTVLDMALIARGWLDPDKEKSDGVFQEMVEDVVSNRQKESAAAGDAMKRLELLF